MAKDSFRRTASSTLLPMETELNVPLFAHECFAGEATADDRVHRRLGRDEPLLLPLELILRVQERIRAKSTGMKGEVGDIKNARH